MLAELISDLKAGNKNIDELSYTEFISLINQTNNPPNSYVTLNEWRIFGTINTTSNLLELASTTGFSSRELVAQTDCTAIGVDVCAMSVYRANSNAKINGISVSKLKYLQQNAFQARDLLLTNKFSHIIIGASLKFIGKQNGEDLFDVLFDKYKHPITILTNEFYADRPLPNEIIEKCKNEFDLNPTNESYKQVMKPYHKLRKTYESNIDHRPETNDETDHYCKSTINRFAGEFGLNVDDEIVSSAYERLRRIKEAANILRPYHSSVTLVHEYIPSEYGKRYTELF